MTKTFELPLKPRDKPVDMPEEYTKTLRNEYQARYLESIKAESGRRLAWCRAFDAASSSTPLSQRRSRSKDLEAVTVVVVRRSRWLIVTDTDELIGVLSRASALPQYLITAMFVGDETVSWMAPSAVR